MKTTMARESDSIRFGTDGWRAVIADEFTFANLERVSQAYADYINRDERTSGPISQGSLDPPLIIIGYDRRFLSEQFARRAAEIMSGNNIEVVLFNEDVPTPLVSWAVREGNASGGIVITASHNPPEFNGFKIKAKWGGSASAKITKAVETCVGLRPPIRKELPKISNSETTEILLASYRKQVSNYVDLERICFGRNRVVIDPMHGSGGRWVESFLQRGAIQAETIRAWRDPLFGGIHPEPIDRNLGALKTRVLESEALLGLATDGDADRLGAVNERGQTITMHEVVPHLLLHLIRGREMTGAVVTTFSQSVLTKRIAASYGLPLYETAIGFKYIAELMLSEDILLGAEESGGIGVKGHIPERDGILNSLLLLEAVIKGGKPPSELIRDVHREFGEFFFDRCDIKMDVLEGQDFVETLAVSPPTAVAKYSISDVKTLDGTKLIFADESWVLFRQSGTEPVLRVYVEATSRSKLDELLRGAVSIAHQNLR